MRRMICASDGLKRALVNHTGVENNSAHPYIVQITLDRAYSRA